MPKKRSSTDSANEDSRMKGEKRRPRPTACKGSNCLLNLSLQGSEAKD